MLVGLVLDGLEWSAGGGWPVPGKPEQRQAPDLAKLATTTPGPLQRKVAETLVLFLEAHSGRQAGAAGDKGPANAAAARASKLLLESGYPSLPGLLVERLKTQPPRAAAEVLAALLRPLAARLDAAALAELAALARKAGPNQDLLAKVVVEALARKPQ